MYLETKNDVVSGDLLVIVWDVALQGDFQESHLQEEALKRPVENSILEQ